MKEKAILLICCVLTMFCIPATGNIIYVDDDGPADFNNIQAAIDDANDGDTVLVADGTYTGDGNRDIDFKGKAITVKSENGPENCIINCEGSEDEYHRGFYFHSGEDANSVLQGFTVTNGYTKLSGGGIHCSSSSPKIVDCILTKNNADRGGGIKCSFSNSVFVNCIISDNWVFLSGGGITCSGNPAFQNCIISGNRADDYAGGIYCRGNSIFTNCTIYGNLAYWGGGGVTATGGSGNVTLFSNCIIWGNIARTGHNNQIQGSGGGITGDIFVSAEYCSIQNGPNDIGVFPPENMIGNWISSEPNFANPGYWDSNDTLDDITDDFWVEGDYHLKSRAGRFDPDSQSWVMDDVTSPCIDVGDPNSPIGYEPFPNGGIINMGAYGGISEASKSYFGERLCETIVAGDINGDCKVDFKDYAIFSLHWLDEY